MTTHQPHHRTRRPLPMLSIVGAGVVSFGLMFLLMTTAYVQDLETLRTAPEKVWLFICGVPQESGTTLPLMLLIGGGATLVGAALLLTDYLRKRPRAAPGKTSPG